MTYRPSISGVYAIIHIASGKRYIGSSKSIDVRWANHRKLLANGTHTSPHLRNAWNKYGEDAFVFEVLEWTLPESTLLCAREHFWMKKFRGKLYNTKPIPEPAETRKGKPGKRFFGKLSADDIQEIGRLYASGVRVKDIAKKFSIKGNYASNVICHSSYPHVRFPDDIERICEERRARCGMFRKEKQISSEVLAIIKWRLENGEHVTAIAEHHGISRRTVGFMKRGQQKYGEKMAAVDAIEPEVKLRKNSKNPKKLSVKDAYDIKMRLWNKQSIKKIAKAYGVANGTIEQIKCGRTYKYVEFVPPTPKPQMPMLFENHSQLSQTTATSACHLGES